MDSGKKVMNKKYRYGVICILAAAVIGIVAVTLYGRSIPLNYIEQIHLQGGYLYYVDRGKNEDLRIIRSDPAGKNGNVIVCDKYDNGKYMLIRQIFFDEENRAYVLIEEINAETQNGLNCKVYQCNFAHGKLTATGYDLTQDVVEYGQIQIQHIRNGCLYYVGISDSEKSPGNAKLFSLDQDAL